MSAHTKGPWRPKVEGTGSGRWISVIADDYEHDDGSPHELLRTETVQTNAGNGWVDVEDADVIRANARLIAAAPDLLAALVAVLRECNTLEVLGEWEALDINAARRESERGRVNLIIMQARDAIARAKGEAS